MAEKKSKRRAGRNKSRARKRAYKLHCHSMRVAGYVTDSNGVWTQNGKSLGLGDAQIRATTGR